MKVLVYATTQINDTLNPKLWDGNKLKSDVREKLLDIVDEFKDYVDLDIKILDAHIVGSNASYNYTDHSDLDLHVVVNFETLDASEEVVNALFNSEKKSFNDDYDLEMSGVNVEIYVEDVKAATVSNGIYSLFEDEWIKEPVKETVSFDDDAVDAKVEELRPQIVNALNGLDSRVVTDVIDDLYLIRKNGLATGGEYSVDNQVFKSIRNEGLLDKLKDKLLELRSKELSI